VCYFFFFNDTATTEIYTLSLHDALPISRLATRRSNCRRATVHCRQDRSNADRKSTRLKSSHTVISYAVFCLKKKKKKTTQVCRVFVDYCIVFTLTSSILP